MIPKVIHYCWFGRNLLPESALKCIESWKKYLPDYTIKEWNEDNFDIAQNRYVREAYEHRKYAFVSDYARLYALYTEGGIYMDTDVEMVGSYDAFLHHPAFSGFETDGNVSTGVMAAQKGSLWAKALLEQYDGRQFVLDDGTFDMTTNATVISAWMAAKGLKMNNEYQEIEGLCAIYPTEYFCPKDHRTGRIHCTPNTVCIHHFVGSWIEFSRWEAFRHNSKMLLAKVLGGKVTTFLADLVTLRVFKKK